MFIRFNCIFFGFILSIRCGRGIAQDERLTRRPPRNSYLYFSLADRSEVQAPEEIFSTSIYPPSFLAIVRSIPPLRWTPWWPYVHVSIFSVSLCSPATHASLPYLHISLPYFHDPILFLVTSAFVGFLTGPSLKRKRTYEFLHTCI